MQEFIKALSWTFVHSLWQGLLAAVLAAIIISLTRRTSARLRYNSLVFVMALFFAGAITTFIFQWNSFSQPGLHNSLKEGEVGVVVAGNSALIDQFISWVNSNARYMILAWTFCFLFSCLRLVTGLSGVNRLRTYRTKPVSIEWKTKLEELQQRMGLRRTVSLLQSELVKVPLALGNLKPVILLPLGLLSNLPVEQVETILLHELAHIRRKDYLANLLQHVVEAIFFFNPALRWLSSLIREEREACCDDMVMAHCNQKTNYFNALISFQDYSTRQPSYAMGISSKKQYLLNRVKRMVTNKNKGTSLFEKFALLGGLILFSAFGFAVREKPIVPKETMAVQRQILTERRTRHVPELPVAENKDATVYNKARHDTLPVNKYPAKKPVKSIKPKPGKTVQDIHTDKSVKPVKPPEPAIEKDSKRKADAALNEIIKLKNEIGVKKETIGEKKQQLGGREGHDKDKLNDEITRERKAIEGKRDELERLRDKWDGLKKQVQNDKDRGTKPNRIIRDKINNKPYNNNFNRKLKGRIIEKQEFQYKMKLDVKTSPVSPKEKSIPVKPNSPEPVRKKVTLGP